MAEPTTPTKPLEEMTKSELFEIAQERQIPGRHDMKKDELLKAVEESLTAPDAPPAADTPDPDAKPDGTEPFAPENEDTDTEPPPDAEVKTNPTNENPSAAPKDPAALAALEDALKADAAAREARELEAENARKAAAEDARRVENARLDEQRAKLEADRAAAHAAGQLTEEDRLALLRAGNADLEDLASDPTTPEFVQVAVKAEQERRKRQAKLDSAKRLMRSPNKQFKITAGPKDMRYVSPSSYVTTLPIGSIVSPLSHDLKHVAEQGFEWIETKGVEVTEDQLGNQVSFAK